MNTGQVCVSPNRCYVHESVYDSFVEAAVDCAKDADIGAVLAEARTCVLEKGKTKQTM